MKILSLSLVGNLRLKLSGTREIHYTPQSNIQLLIGTNGSGKSTLLNELSPLPALKNDYEKGGYKQIDIHYRGYYYRLRSDFNKEQTHSFIRANTLEGLAEGVNLNDGHTLTVQKQLVETHFRYTSDVHELLLGNVRLTLLGPQKRKEWFVKLCNVDVSYAVEVYQRLATNARNVLGARKHTEQKLLDEKSRLLSEDEIDVLRTEIAALTKLSRSYSEAKTSMSSVSNQFLVDLETKISAHLVDIERLSNDIINASSLDLRPATSVSEYRELVDDAKSAVNVTEERLSSLKREYESIDQLVSLLSKDDGRSLEDLTVEHADVSTELGHYDLNDNFVQRDDLKGVFTDATQIADQLDDLLLKMPKNVGMEKFNRTLVAEYEDAHKRSQASVDKLTFAIQTRERRMEELNRHKPTECPNCNHVWIPGISENELTHLAEQITELSEKLITTTLLRDGQRDYLEAANEWKEYYAQYAAYVREYPRLAFIWDYFSESKRLMDNPTSLVGYVRQLLPRITAAIDVRGLLDRRDLLEAAINQRKQLEGDKGKVLTQRAEYLDNALRDAQQTLHSQRLTYQRLKTTFDKLQYLGNQKMLLSEKLEDVSQCLIKKDQYVKNRLLDKEIDNTLLTLAGLSKQFNDAIGKSQIVEHLETTLGELRQSEADYRLLLQSLSPTEGLIADSLMGFIYTVTEQMNYIISQIWTSSIKVLPCHAERGDLDYKFPLAFDRSLTVPDVSLGSKGQKELVDYVFVLIAMIYLDLKDYPLLMDEVGHSFHDSHRIRLFDYIKRLLDQGTVGQIFVVSHFSNTHGTLTHADVNVIDNTGVLVPPNANRYFILK